MPVFLGYAVVRGAPEVTASLMDEKRLPLLLDLDETLLSAVTRNSLKGKIFNLERDLAALDPRCVRLVFQISLKPSMLCLPTLFPTFHA